MNEHELESVMIFYSTEHNWGPETMDLFSDFMELRSKRKSITNPTQYFSSIWLRAWENRGIKRIREVGEEAANSLNIKEPVFYKGELCRLTGIEDRVMAETANQEEEWKRGWQWESKSIGHGQSTEGNYYLASGYPDDSSFRAYFEYFGPKDRSQDAASLIVSRGLAFAPWHVDADTPSIIRSQLLRRRKLWMFAINARTLSWLCSRKQWNVFWSDIESCKDHVSEYMRSMS